ncbi:MAG: carboxymuconolactone decarboxylase family protein [Novosphingobium sp.]|nr:carboxymuconolactone decarboxylase family protein [Novosphingobium sp.]
MNEAEQRGLELFAEVYGAEMADGARRYYESGTDFGAEQARWTMEWAFGSVWCREGLSRKMRSCVVLGMLIGQVQPEEIRYHTKMAIANGLTRKELEEIFYTAIPYCGFPAAATAKAAMLEAFAELGGQGESA